MEPIKKNDNLSYIDNKEFQSKFYLQPDIGKINDSDFAHFDKNFAMTNLKHNPKIGIDEPGEMRSILRGLHVLNNDKHYFDSTERILIGHNKRTEEDGSITMIPVYEQKEIRRSKFPKTFHSLQAEVISFVNCAASRNGHRIDKAITNKLVKEESISQKTDVPSRWGFKKE